MELRKSGRRMWAVFISSLFLPVISLAAPTVNNIIVTDVTTRSFSVIWTSNEASTPTLDVYEYADGSGELVGNIEAFPINCNSSLQTVAESLGIMKVQVTGLEANTTYYFKTITNSATEQTEYPDIGDPLLEVNTATLTVRTDSSNHPISNDIIISDWTMADDSTADGTLVLASVTGGAYPMTSFVGDCAPSGSALIDLNNMFDRSTGQNFDLSQGVNLNLVNFRGMDGITQIVHEVPQDNLLAEVKQPSPGLKPGWNMFSFQIDPTSSGVLTVLEPINSNYLLIQTYNAAEDDWRKYKKDNPYPWENDLDQLTAYEGYWLVMGSSTSLKLEGNLLEDQPISLTAGWNLVGYRSLETKTLASAIGSISDYLILIQTYNNSNDTWLKYKKDNLYPWTNTLKHVEPGKSYWIVVSDNCNWY